MENILGRKDSFIADLSSPHCDLDKVSIDKFIVKESCRLTYVKIDDAIKAMQQFRRNASLCKVDISNAFKNVSIKSCQWPHICVKWRIQQYVYVRLVF